VGALRVLIAYEDSHRAYGETVAMALRRLRPSAEVSVVRVRELGSEVDRFDPHLVICNRPNTVDPGGRAKGSLALLNGSSHLKSPASPRPWCHWWQVPVPESLVAPSVVSHAKSYSPSLSVSFKTPHSVSFLNSLLGFTPDIERSVTPPVPTTNSRMPPAALAVPSGFCGAKRS
jgi:hypothetical protein